MHRAFIAAALIIGFWGASSQAQEKKAVTVLGVEKNAAGCEKSHAYVLQIFPDKVVSTIASPGSSGHAETIALNSDGVFLKEYKSVSGLRMRIEGNVKTHQLRVSMMSFYTCVWEGTI